MWERALCVWARSEAVPHTPAFPLSSASLRCPFSTVIPLGQTRNLCTHSQKGDPGVSVPSWAGESRTGWTWAAELRLLYHQGQDSTSFCISSKLFILCLWIHAVVSGFLKSLLTPTYMHFHSLYLISLWIFKNLNLSSIWNLFWSIMGGGFFFTWFLCNLSTNS